MSPIEQAARICESYAKHCEDRMNDQNARCSQAGRHLLYARMETATELADEIRNLKNTPSPDTTNPRDN